MTPVGYLLAVKYCCSVFLAIGGSAKSQGWDLGRRNGRVKAVVIAAASGNQAVFVADGQTRRIED